MSGDPARPDITEFVKLSLVITVLVFIASKKDYTRLYYTKLKFYVIQIVEFLFGTRCLPETPYRVTRVAGPASRTSGSE